MSSPESISSSSSTESDQSGDRPVGRPSQTQRPLPNLPLPRLSPPPTKGQSQRDQALAASRNRPLPLSPSAIEQSAEEHRRSIIALDRKRRLTNTYSYEEGRRRTNSGGWNSRIPSVDGSSSSRLQTAEVIDLTGSSPPTPQHRTLPARRASRNSSYVVPPWQPDTEVSACPICNRQFSWMFRRHHCRKCGRVVCNECSPHRITIPRQFMVHPPGLDEAVLGHRHSQSVDSSDGESDAVDFHHIAPYLEGGEKVRLCNPCVPDPQPEPFQTYPAPTAPPLRQPQWNQPRQQPAGTSLPGALDGRFRAYSAGGGIGQPTNTHPINTMHSHNYHRSVGGMPSSLGNQSTRGDGLSLFGSFTGQMSPGRYRGHNPSASMHQQPHLTSMDMLSQDPRQLHSGQRPSISRPQARDEPFGSPGYSSRGFPRPLHELTHSAAIRGPRINEEDRCPVCRHELPPRGPDGNETAREAHIMECISARDPSHHAEASNMAAAVRTAEEVAERADGPSSHPHRNTHALHMLSFVATEKDCVSQEEGQVEECSICMVEYDVGDELVRLECLCKFHRACIREWVERKAECPVHKLMR